MDMDKSIADGTIMFTKIKSTDSTIIAIMFYAFLSCDQATFIDIYVYLLCCSFYILTMFLDLLCNSIEFELMI